MGNDRNDMPKVSVIVPVYNMERYLAKCLDALVNQTLADIEVIAINDGSTDSSLAILESYAARDSRIRIIDKPNSGYGASMNRGLAEARGTYIGIVEPDDYPDRVMFQKLYEAALKHDCDLVKCNYYRMYTESEHPEWNLHGFGYDEPFDPVDRPSIVCTVPSIWAALYRRSMLVREGVRFRETPGAAFQDTSFTLEAWFASKRCVLVRRPLLHYRMDNPGSSSKTTDKVYTVCDELATAEEFMRARPVRAGSFAPWFHVGKWGKYRWNYERIAPELHGEFAQRMYEEYTAARDAGELLLDLFGANSRSQVRYLLEAGPEAFAARYPELYPYDWEEDSWVADGSADEAIEVSSGPSPAVTIMIAAHNSEAYIADCVESLRAQTFGDFEAIIVNDGSTDATSDVARAHIGDDARFSVIECTTNGGPGAARNKALERAKGEYVMYVDSDDMLVAEGLAKLVSRARYQKLDELHFSAFSFYDGKSLLLSEDFSGRASFDGVATGRELFTFFSDRGQYYSQGALRMARRAMLEQEQIRFPEGIIHEDVLYSFRIMTASQRSSFINEPIYLRRQRAGSIMGASRRTAGNVYGHLVSIRAIRQWLDENAEGLDEDFALAVAREVGQWSHVLAHDWLDELTEEERDELLGAMTPEERLSFKLDILGPGEAAERAADEWRESKTYRLGDAVATVPRWAKLNISAILGRRKLEKM